MTHHQRNLVIFGAVLLFLVAGMQACMKFGGNSTQGSTAPITQPK